MPIETDVWMVPLGRGPATEIAGAILLAADGLQFTPHSEGVAGYLIRFATMDRVKAMRASPILMIEHREPADTAKRRTAFYFVQPPSLTHLVKERGALPAPPEHVDLRSIRPLPFGMGQRGPSKRRTVRTNATYLAQQAGPRKQELREWAEAIRERMRD